MTFTTAMKKRFGLALLAGAALLGASSAQGQAQAQAYGQPAYREDPGTALTRHLRSLSDNPRSLHALMGAAAAALQLGDPQAAVTFYARAEEIAPRDGRIKAGMGAAFVQMEQAQSALKFFSDAAGMGVSEAEFAGDRGLAYDLMGDNRQAQRDYRLALGRRNDPEVERRLALSLAISGDKAGAMQAIGNQLARQDRAAWRTRAFILALTGDAAGATKAVQAVMPAQALAMQPFLARLASLDAPGRAMAVHFGHFPGDARPVQMAQATPFVAPPPAATQTGRPDSGQAILGSRPEPASTAIRRRPDAAGTPATATPSPLASNSVTPAEQRARRGTQNMSLAERMAENEARIEAAARAKRAAASSEPKPTQFAVAGAAPPPGPVLPPVARIAEPIATPPPAPATVPPAAAEASAAPRANPPATSSSPTYVPPTLEPFGPPAFDASAPRAITSSPATPAPVGSTAQAPAGSVMPGSAAAAIQTVALPESRIQTPPPAEAPTPAPAATAEAAAPKVEAPAPAQRKPLAFAEVVEAVRALPEAGGAAKESAPAGKAAAPAASEGKSRHWVQIASAPDSLVESEYRRLKRKHAGLLSDKEGYRTPMGKSNRVLVGPFASAGEARDFVGALKKNSLTAIAWTSADGQEIKKLPAR